MDDSQIENSLFLLYHWDHIFSPIIYSQNIKTMQKQHRFPMEALNHRVIFQSKLYHQFSTVLKSPLYQLQHQIQIFLFFVCLYSIIYTTKSPKSKSLFLSKMQILFFGAPFFQIKDSSYKHHKLPNILRIFMVAAKISKLNFSME